MCLPYGGTGGRDRGTCPMAGQEDGTGRQAFCPVNMGQKIRSPAPHELKSRSA